MAGCPDPGSWTAEKSDQGKWIKVVQYMRIGTTASISALDIDLNNMSELQHLSEHSLNVKIYLILNTFPYISYHWTFIERQCTGIFLFSSTFLQDFSRPKMWLITLKSSKPQSFWCSNFSTVRAENGLEKDRQLVVVIWSTFTNATPIIQMLKRWRIADPSSPLWF